MNILSIHVILLYSEYQPNGRIYSIPVAFSNLLYDDMLSIDQCIVQKKSVVYEIG